MRQLFARVRIDPHHPQAKADLVRLLVALCQLSRLPTAAARRRAYRRIPKPFRRAMRREMSALIRDLRCFGRAA
jgi:hypothetical protein